MFTDGCICCQRYNWSPLRFAWKSYAKSCNRCLNPFPSSASDDDEVELRIKPNKKGSVLAGGTSANVERMAHSGMYINPTDAIKYLTNQERERKTFANWKVYLEKMRHTSHSQFVQRLQDASLCWSGLFFCVRKYFYPTQLVEYFFQSHFQRI